MSGTRIHPVIFCNELPNTWAFSCVYRVLHCLQTTKWADASTHAMSQAGQTQPSLDSRWPGRHWFQAHIPCFLKTLLVWLDWLELIMLMLIKVSWTGGSSQPAHLKVRGAQICLHLFMLSYIFKQLAPGCPQPVAGSKVSELMTCVPKKNAWEQSVPWIKNLQIVVAKQSAEMLNTKPWLN